jgi:hypothetical protein
MVEVWLSGSLLSGIEAHSIPSYLNIPSEGPVERFSNKSYKSNMWRRYLGIDRWVSRLHKNQVPYRNLHATTKDPAIFVRTPKL